MCGHLWGLKSSDLLWFHLTVILASVAELLYPSPTCTLLMVISRYRVKLNCYACVYNHLLFKVLVMYCAELIIV